MEAAKGKGAQVLRAGPIRRGAVVVPTPPAVQQEEQPVSLEGFENPEAIAATEEALKPAERLTKKQRRRQREAAKQNRDSLLKLGRHTQTGAQGTRQREAIEGEQVEGRQAQDIIADAKKAGQGQAQEQPPAPNQRDTEATERIKAAGKKAAKAATEKAPTNKPENVVHSQQVANLVELAKRRKEAGKNPRQVLHALRGRSPIGKGGKYTEEAINEALEHFPLKRLKKGKPDAIPKQSTESVDARKQTRNGKRVGEGNKKQEAPAARTKEEKEEVQPSVKKRLNGLFASVWAVQGKDKTLRVPREKELREFLAAHPEITEEVVIDATTSSSAVEDNIDLYNKFKPKDTGPQRMSSGGRLFDPRPPAILKAAVALQAEGVDLSQWGLSRKIQYWIKKNNTKYKLGLTEEDFDRLSPVYISKQLQNVYKQTPDLFANTRTGKPRKTKTTPLNLGVKELHQRAIKESIEELLASDPEVYDLNDPKTVDRVWSFLLNEPEFASEASMPNRLLIKQAIAAYKKQQAAVNDNEKDNGSRSSIAERTANEGFPVDEANKIIAKWKKEVGYKLDNEVIAVWDFAELRDTKLYNDLEKIDLSDRDFARESWYVHGASGIIIKDGHVILFTSRINDAGELVKVLSHELVGHYGMAAIFGGGIEGTGELQYYLKGLYRRNETFRREVTKVLNQRGRTDSDELAMEEALADIAGEAGRERRALKIRSPLLAVVKDFIDWAKLQLYRIFGYQFKDAEIYDLLAKSREFLRSGKISPNLPSAPRRSSGAAPVDPDRVDALKKIALQAGQATHIDPTVLHNVREAFRRQPGNMKRLVGRAMNHLQTLDNMAMNSTGLHKILGMLRDIVGTRDALMQESRKLMPRTLTPGELRGLGIKLKDGERGATQAEINEAGELLAYGSLYKLPKITEAMLKKLPELLKNGRLQWQNMEALLKIGEVTPEEFNKGIEWFSANGEAKAGDYKNETVTKDSMSYLVYQEHMRALATAHMRRLQAVAEANGLMSEQSIDQMLNDINRGTGKNKTNRPTTDADRIWFKKVLESYLELYFEDATVNGIAVKTNKEKRINADEFLVEVLKALHSDDKVLDWQDPTRPGKRGVDKNEPEHAARFRADPKYQDLISGMPAARSIGVTQATQKKLLHIFQENVERLTQVREAELSAKRSIAGAHVPLRRRGKYQVGVTAVDENGNHIELSREFKDTLPYFKTDDFTDAKNISDELQELLGADTLWTMYDKQGNKVEVKLVASHDVAQTEGTLAESVSFDAFIRMSQALGVEYTPEERERLINGLTRLGERARGSLQRSGNPGWDKDTSKSVREFLEQMARWSAKAPQLPFIDQIWENNKNWLGDAGELNRLQAAFDTAPNHDARVLAEQELRGYAYAYANMAPIEAGVEDFTIRTSQHPNGVKIKFLGRGNEFRGEAQKLIKFIRASADVSTSTEDLLSEKAGPLGLATVLFQLGASPASAIVNMTSLVLTTMPYLTSIDPRTGRGGGFGDIRTSQTLMKTVGNIINPLFSDPERIDEVIEAREWAKHGLTEDEIAFLSYETKHGVLQAAYQISLVGSAVNQGTNVLVQKGIENWMWMFSQVEMLNRRVTALTAYRLYKERMVAAGSDPTSFSNQNSRDYQKIVGYTNDAVFFTQGDYNMYNRPSLFRGNFLQHVFKYKMFPIIVLQLLRHMPASAVGKMLALLFLVGGLKALPGADDALDILDTIAQKLGLKTFSLETEIRKMADDFIPGSGQFVMRGLIDAWLSGTLSTRVGMGDLIPFTGALRAGADVGRELESALGPVFGNTTATMDWAGTLADYLFLQKTGLKDDTLTFADIIRTSPIAGVRALGEAAIYASDGVITNQRGQVVSTDANTQTIIARALGFYPTVATQQNDIIRLSRYNSSYISLIKRGYVTSWAQAQRANNRARMRSIEEDVRDWNRAARDAGREEFVISGFMDAAMRSARANRKSALNRYIDAAPRSTRAGVSQLAEQTGLDPDEVSD